jgi:hypothetical protein
MVKERSAGSPSGRRTTARPGTARGPKPEPAPAGAAEPEPQIEADAEADAGVEVEAIDGPAGAAGGRLLDDRIVRVDLWATVVFGLVSIVAVLWSAAVVAAVAIDIALFVAGCGAFFYAYFKAIGRSRDEVVDLAGLFFLAQGTAPRPVARALRLLLAAQVVLALATAAARPFTSLAFGVLVPMFGLAMLGLWGGVHGRFRERPPPGVKAERQRDQPREASE